MKIKPCPFCGGELRLNIQGTWEDTNEKCIFYGFELANRDDDIAAWNRREPMDKVVEQLEALPKHDVEAGKDYICMGEAISKRLAIEIVKKGGVE